MTEGEILNASWEQSAQRSPSRQVDSNPGPAYCEAPVLPTGPLCSPTLSIHPTTTLCLDVLDYDVYISNLNL